VGGQLESMRAHTLFLSILFLSLPALAFSENATAEGAPPPVPSTGGLVAMQALLVNGTPAVGMPLLITATKSDGAATTYRLITGREGNVILTLERGSYQLDCVLDDMATSGADYAATASLSLPGEQNLSLVFYPAGSVAVTVLEGGQVVPGANMHVSCASDWFDYGKMNGANAQAGQAGDFIFRALPAGTCVVSASTQTSAQRRLSSSKRHLGWRKLQLCLQQLQRQLQLPTICIRQAGRSQCQLRLQRNRPGKEGCAQMLGRWEMQTCTKLLLHLM
jgi:hypothetical protein